MARFEAKSIALGVIQDTDGDVVAGQPFTLSGGPLYAAETGGTTLSGGSLVYGSTPPDTGKLPGWFDPDTDPGIYSLTVGTQTVKFMVGDSTRVDSLESTSVVLTEYLPNVEEGQYESLRTGDDWTASFNAIRTAVGAGGIMAAGARTYELSSFAPLTMQRIQGQGPEYTVLKAKSGATRVVDLTGTIRHAALKDLKIDGRSKAAEGTRLQALNGTGGEASQITAFENVAWRNCSTAHRVAGTGAVPQAGQADKVIYLNCSIYDCDIGMSIDTVDAQQQVWLGGDIGSCLVCCVDLYGGGFTLAHGQMQMPAVGTGTMVRFLGPNVDRVVFFDAITEGWLNGLDSTAANCWPLNGVLIEASTFQIHAAGGGFLANVDRGGVPVHLTARESTLNGGAVVLEGADTLFHEEYCNGTYTVTRTGGNCKHHRLTSTGWDDGLGKRAVGGGGEPAFGATWANQGGGYSPLTFERTLHGTVRVNGTIVSGGAGAAANDVIFTLPTGYRPATLMAQIAGTGAWAVNGIIVATDGTVKNNVAVGAAVTLFVNMEFPIR